MQLRGKFFEKINSLIAALIILFLIFKLLQFLLEFIN